MELTRVRFLTFFVIICVSPSVNALPVIGGPTYDAATATGYLGTGNSFSTPRRWVNDHGQAVLNQEKRFNGTTEGFRSYVFSALDGSYRDLNPEGEDSSGYAYMGTTSINRLGEVAGVSGRYTSFGAERGNVAVRWTDSSNAPITLPSLGSELRADGHRYFNAVANDINDTGTIVGVSSDWDSSGTTYYGIKPVVWSSATAGIVELPSPVGGSADRVNNAGVVVGRLGQPGSLARYGRWSPSHQLTELVPLFPLTSVAQPFVTDLNELGNIVGQSIDGVGDIYPVIWHFNNPSGAPTQISTQPGYAVAINDLNTVVGVTGRGSSRQGIRWFANGSSQTLGFVEQITDINNSNTVIGTTATGFVESIWFSQAATPVALASLVTQPTTGGVWITSQVQALALTDTGFLLGRMPFDPDGSGPLEGTLRAFQMLIPQAGTYGQGDANFDERVDFTDLVLLSRNYGSPNPNLAFTVGDFNLDGVVGFSDLLALARNYGTGPSSVAGASAQFNTDWQRALSMVPEPGVVMLAIAAAPAMLRRRRSV